MADKVFSVDKAEDSSGFLLWQVTTLWQRGLKAELEKVNLTHAQFVLLASLMWLSNNEEGVMQIELSNHSKIDPMTTSTVLRTLQTKGFVKRQEHPKDTRAKVVACTSIGIKVAKQAIRIVETFDRKFFSVMGPKQSELNRSFEKLIEGNQ
jgi:DNA-binding MarR family transcriptional regulator